MKLIEAMKRVKANKEKITDLQQKVAVHCANLEHETPVYGSETGTKVKEWLQACTDLSQENVRLLVSIQRTNLSTPVAIELGGKSVVKNIAEWVWRRREYAKLDEVSYSKLTDRGLKEGLAQSSTGQPFVLKIQRHYDPTQRDERLSVFRSETHAIDAALEITNAVTDLVEA